MKKIKGIKQLKAEKQRLNRRQLALEMMMQEDWNELKIVLNPVNIVKEKIKRAFQPKTGESRNKESILHRAFTFGVHLLGKKFAGFFKRRT